VSHHGAARSLEAEGVRTARGYPAWRADTVRGLLRRREYLGEVRFAGHVLDKLGVGTPGEAAAVARKAGL
jgi:hypothetical protein